MDESCQHQQQYKYYTHNKLWVVEVNDGGVVQHELVLEGGILAWQYCV